MKKIIGILSIVLLSIAANAQVTVKESLTILSGSSYYNGVIGKLESSSEYFMTGYDYRYKKPIKLSFDTITELDLFIREIIYISNVGGSNITYITSSGYAVKRFSKRTVILYDSKNKGLTLKVNRIIKFQRELFSIN